MVERRGRIETDWLRVRDLVPVLFVLPVWLGGVGEVSVLSFFPFVSES